MAGLPATELPRWGVRMEDRINFFRMGWVGGTMCHPPVALIEDDCVA